MKKSYTLRMFAAAALSFFAAATASAQGIVSTEAPLPAIYITTDDPNPEINREEYIGAKYYLKANGTEGVEDIASEEAPLPLQLRGRGNWTWVGYDKKPYRLLLDAPAPMAGLKSSDYFGLHAHADDNLGFMRNTLGFELARRLGIDWTPSHSPVELYLNGEYRGLYFCTELVRVDPDRVDVYKQADNDNSDLTGGWLVEIDNYNDDPHITFKSGSGNNVTISHKTPLSLSDEQAAWLKNQMETIDRGVYAADKSVAEWADLVDLDRLARFYIVHELMDNYEAFHGSCFLHRDRGEDRKWMFGPVWDFGSSFFRGSGKFIWQDAGYSLVWIEEMYKFPDFLNKVKEVWSDFCDNGYDGLDEFIASQAERIKAGAARDFERWPEYGNADMDACVRKMTYMLGNKTRWLGQQWGKIPASAPENVELFLRGTFNNWGTDQMLMPQDDGTYTLEIPSLMDQVKIASADWSTAVFGGNGVTLLKAGVPYQMVSGSGGHNISVYGEITDAKLTFDPVEQTLLVEGTQHEPVVEEVHVYFRGDMNSWKTDMEFAKRDDGIYALDIDNLTGKFKIADAKFLDINLGGDNVTPVEPGVPYKLLKSGKNISLSRDVARARMEVDLDGKTLLLTDLDTSGIEEVSADRTPVRIFTLQGFELPAGTAPAPGIYIVLDKSGKASKHFIR
ncbi:MAG: CotH kinase family protein [Muribaculaceae bacterium]|nr:CotH kinase family protein [Muribaculaceae bacterium]